MPQPANQSERFPRGFGRAIGAVALAVIACTATAAPQGKPDPILAPPPVDLTPEQVQRFRTINDADGAPRYLVIHRDNVPMAVEQFAAELRQYLGQCNAELVSLDRLAAADRREVQNSVLVDDAEAMRQVLVRRGANEQQDHELVADLIIRIDGRSGGGNFASVVRMVDIRRGRELMNVAFPIADDSLPFQLRRQGVAVFGEITNALDRAASMPFRSDLIIYGLPHGGVADDLFDRVEAAIENADRLHSASGLRPRARDDWQDQAGAASRLRVEISHWGRERDLRRALESVGLDMDPNPIRLEFTSRSPVLMVAYAQDPRPSDWVQAADRADDQINERIEKAISGGRNTFVVDISGSSTQSADWERLQMIGNEISKQFIAHGFERLEVLADGGTPPVYEIALNSGGGDEQPVRVRLVRTQQVQTLASEYWPHPRVLSTGREAVTADASSLGRYLGGSLLAQFSQTASQSNPQQRIHMTVVNADFEQYSAIRRSVESTRSVRVGRTDYVTPNWSIELWYREGIDQMKEDIFRAFEGLPFKVTVEEVSDRGIRVRRHD